MIQANELRIGNWVIRKEYIKRYNAPDYLEEYNSKVSANTIACAADDLSIDFVSPIPLTPEILEKCGFVNGEIIHSYHTKIMVKPFQTVSQGLFHGEWQVVLIAAVPYSLGIRIKHLHQLQNLYFALTGAELQINL